jgi:hypothetical protein
VALEKLKRMHCLRGRIDGPPSFLPHIAERLFGEAEIRVRMDRITTRKNKQRHAVRLRRRRGKKAPPSDRLSYTPHVATPPSSHFFLLSFFFSGCDFDNRGLVTFVLL